MIYMYILRLSQQKKGRKKPRRRCDINMDKLSNTWGKFAPVNEDKLDKILKDRKRYQ